MFILSSSFLFFPPCLPILQVLMLDYKQTKVILHFISVFLTIPVVQDFTCPSWNSIS